MNAQKKANRVYKSITRGVSTAAKVAETAAKAYSIASGVARLVNAEMKLYEVSGSTNPAIAGITPVKLSHPSQGDGYLNRDGDSIKLQKLLFNWKANINASATRSMLRIIIFRARQERGTDPTQTQLMGSATPNPLDFRDWQYRKGFVVLYDRLLLLDPEHEAEVSRKTIKLRGHVEFEAASQAASDGGIYLVAFSDEATNTPGFNFRSRCFFTDN